MYSSFSVIFTNVNHFLLSQCFCNYCRKNQKFFILPKIVKSSKTVRKMTDIYFSMRQLKPGIINKSLNFVILVTIVIKYLLFWPEKNNKLTANPSELYQNFLYIELAFDPDYLKWTLVNQFCRLQLPSDVFWHRLYLPVFALRVSWIFHQDFFCSRNHEFFHR